MAVPHVGRRGVLTLLLVAAVAASLLGVRFSDGILHTGGVSSLVWIATSITHPELSPSFLGTVAGGALTTVSYAVAGTSLAVLLGIPAAVLASGVLARRRTGRVATTVAVRAVLAVLRAIDELIWALLFVTVFGLSPLAGVLAIGLPYAAMIGRVLAERLQDVPDEPLEALRSAGASPAQVLVYGRLPHVLADTVGYLFYRLECAVRAAAILSFVGLGGLGLQLTLALDDLRFERIWTVFAALVVIIVGIDVVSARLRGRLAL